MKTLHQFLLGAGLLVAGPVAWAQGRADYVGTWLNTASYTQAVAKLEINDADRWAPSLVAWEGLPANAARRELGYLWSRPAPDGTVTRMVARLKTADVAEMYCLDLQPDGALWVLRHVGRAGQTLRCDTMRFERCRRPAAVGKRGDRLATGCPPAPAEVALHFAPTDPPSRAEPALLALRIR